MFEDRRDAGRRLAELLSNYRKSEALVLAIPCGGVEVGYQVAEALALQFELLISRKLPMPGNPEAGVGAIAEDGSTYLVPGSNQRFGEAEIERIRCEQQAEIERRIRELRRGRPLPTLNGRQVILIDDGVAMGSTMRASIACCRNQDAAEVIVAVPVAGPRVVPELERLADKVVCVESPRFFRAVAQVYRHWRDVPDEEVLEIMQRRTR